MASNWFFGRGGQKIGPFTAHQMQQLAALGMVKPEDHLLEDGATKWVGATTLTWLSFSRGNQQYFLNVSGKAYGPYTSQQVRAALLSGRLPPETPACPQGAKQWLPLQQMTEFRSSVPTAVKESEVPSRIGGPTMTREEAELYLAGKRGDALARLVALLQDIRKRFMNNPSIQEVIGRNIRDLLELREKGNIVPAR
jgi:uncharacterized protein DUF4339